MNNPTDGNDHDDPILLLHRFLKIGTSALAEMDPHHVLTTVMDGVIDAYGAERGMILLFDEEGETLFEVRHNLSKEALESPECEVSRTMVAKVRTKGTSVCLYHVLAELHKQNSGETSNISSAMCLPLRYKGDVFGIIYLDTQTAPGKFEPTTCFFFREFADFISLAAHHALERRRLHTRVQTFEVELRGKYHFESIMGHHPAMVEALRLVSRVADTDATVLIQGESGTGKELIARALHYNSRRKDKPFVPVNCGALPEPLLESELFGHVGGAFTSATQGSVGLFESADGGAIFLDEVNDMSPALQVKLLRVLQTGEYSRVGSPEIHHCGARVIAATSQDLQNLVKEGTFREEVYYRLSIIDIWLPPLRDRQCDIPLLAHHFLQVYGTKYGKQNLRLSSEAEAFLLTYDLPGHVRELENMMQRAVILAEGETIPPEHLAAHAFWGKSTPKVTEPPLTFKAAKQQMVEQFERDYLEGCLRAAHGNVTHAAQSADLHLTNVYAKLKKYDINPHAFKI